MKFQLNYFKSWKMMLWKCCTQYASKFGKLSSGHRTGKGQFSFQSQRKAMPKNTQTTAQLLSRVSKVMLKILQARLQQYVKCELPDVQAGFRKGRGNRSNFQNPLDHWKSKRVPEKHLLLQLLLSRFSHVRLCDPMDGTPCGSPVHGIFQARVLEWVAIAFSDS